jgi:Ca-activated chloride channel homolog
MARLLSLITGAALLVALAACGRPATQFSIVAGSENTVLQPLVEEFCAERNTTCTFSYEGSLDIGLALASPEGVTADAVWPASSVWIDLFDSQRRVRNATSIAQMPVILGVQKSEAESLDWVGRDVYMADILDAVDGGRLKFLMTSATQSNSGASAYFAMLSSALGGKPVIEPGDLDQPEVRDMVQALLRGVERSSGSSGWLADLYVEQARTGAAYQAMWNYEAVLKETNDRLADIGREPLYAIYPADGVAVADSPLGFVDHGRGAETEQFFTDLVAYLQSEPIARRIADTGRRIPFAGSDIMAAAEPDWNFDPARVITAIRTPEPAVIRQALDLYQGALRKPSLTALCLDYSGSMQGNGESQLEEAMTFLLTPERASEVLVQWTPQDRILVYPFDDGVRTRLSASGAIEEQRDLLSTVVGQSSGGGTDMYSCASEALRQLQAEPDLDDFLPAIVILTDGRSDGNLSAFMSQWYMVRPSVPVFGITFGDADQSQLDAIAAATAARVFDGRADLAGAFRAARGYN